jgi:pimeloyl-ACP methyl ester carboxylesterase
MGTLREAAYREAEGRLWASLGVVPRERRVRLAGLGCAVRVQAVGNGKPVLFIHGASTAGTSWATLAAALDDRTCLLVDRPGTGLSEPLDRTPRNAVEMNALASRLLPELLDALDLDCAAVVATSLGGFFAFRGAIAAPDRVSRLVEIGWTPAAITPSVPMVMRVGSVPLLGHVLAALPASTTTVRRLFAQIGLREALAAGRVSEEAIDAYAALLNHTPTMQLELALGRAMVSPIRGIDRRLALTPREQQTLRMPILVAWGDHDPFGSLDVARAFVRGFPNADLVELPGVGHAPWMDDAGMVATHIRSFISDEG